jgi:hypothetical protein
VFLIFPRNQSVSNSYFNIELDVTHFEDSNDAKSSKSELKRSHMIWSKFAQKSQQIGEEERA